MSVSRRRGPNHGPDCQPTGRLLFPPIPHTNWISAIAFHPGGKLVATGDYSGLVRTWDLSNGREIGRPLYQEEIVLALFFSPDGKMLAVGLAHDRTGKPDTRLWDATTRQPIGELLPNAGDVTRVDFGPDCRAPLAATNQTTQLWRPTPALPTRGTGGEKKGRILFSSMPIVTQSLRMCFKTVSHRARPWVLAP
jgi:WD40 repeat protein